MRLAVLALGLALYSDVSGQSFHEPTEPQDATDPAYLGRCSVKATVSEDGRTLAVQVSGEPAWGDFNYRGVLHVRVSSSAAEGPSTTDNISFGSRLGDGDPGIKFEDRATQLGYLQQVTPSWCHAYRGTQTRQLDESSDDFRQDDYLGHCTINSERTRDGRWRVWIDGDPAWGDEFDATAYLDILGANQPDGPYGDYPQMMFTSRSAFNGQQVGHYPWNREVKYIDRIEEHYCHAFRARSKH